MSIRGYYKKKRQQETNFILIILGLLLIFIIGYIFWERPAKSKKVIDKQDEEPETLIKLKSGLVGKIALKTTKEMQLENIASKRNKYFVYTRFTLVLLMVGAFLILQFYWVPELYRKSHWFDNLRNFVTAVILGFTTIAFITKGSLKSFKESIEGMAIKWFFKDEAVIKAEIQELEEDISHLTEKINQLELEKSIEEHETALVNEVVTGKVDVRDYSENKQ